MMRVSLKDPVGQANRYLKYIRRSNITRQSLPKYTDVMVGTGSLNSSNSSSEYDNFKTVLSTAMVHPHDSLLWGYLSNWYDDKDIQRRLRNKEAFYKPVHRPHINQFFGQQEKFIERAKRTDFEITEEMIEDYLKFMHLVKSENDGICVDEPKQYKCVPTFGIDIVWHSHMLDLESYRKDSWDYFGYLLNHDDSEDNNLKDHFERTKQRWAKAFGSNKPYGIGYVPVIGAIGVAGLNTNRKDEPKKSNNDSGASGCSTYIPTPISGSSCSSSCGSSCGSGCSS